MRPVRWRRAAVCGLVAAGISGTQGLAQDQAGGTHSTISTSIGVEAGRNLDLDPGAKDKSARLYGTLGYAYEMRTRVTQLSFSASIRPQTDDDNGDGLFPQASLRWSHETARMRFSFNASHVEAKVTDQSIAYDETTGQILNYDTSGTRISNRFGAAVEGGIDMPLGYTIRVDRSEVDYRDTSEGSNNNPSTSTGLQAALRADVSSMTQLNLTLDHRYYETEGDRSLRNRTTDLASIGLQQRIDALTSFNGSIGKEWIDTKRIDVPDKSLNGLIFSLGVERLDTLGSYRVDFAQSQTENGNRQSFTVGRDRETMFGRFSGGVGASRGEEGDTDWIGNLAYRTELPRDTLSANMSRSVTTDNDGDDVVVTRVSAGLGHKLSEVNGLNFGLTASITEYATYDKNRLDATISYEHMLVKDVSLEAGVKLGIAKTTDQEQARSQSVFLSLSRSFDFLH
ncbi:hypothetical protein [Paenirhodobacter populi]|uniref:TIGR03016 family PEP-CTERM system-associated outer membrane protein n=1 Tax=Paenirhodobacter populi TaxID=2306993 RepID=A0A443JC06_9RHOB|nr:hypothetical protein [Sinirhodobacter populi]RWR18004.1 hypothetical protein D2T30_17320 [Sinirhodobacter populi]